MRELLEKNKIGEVISIEGSEHIVPSHGAFYEKLEEEKKNFQVDLC